MVRDRALSLIDMSTATTSSGGHQTNQIPRRKYAMSLCQQLCPKALDVGLEWMRHAHAVLNHACLLPGLEARERKPRTHPRDYADCLRCPIELTTIESTLTARWPGCGRHNPEVGIMSNAQSLRGGAVLRPEGH